MADSKAKDLQAHTAETTVHTAASAQVADKDINQPNPRKPLGREQKALEHFVSGRHELINSHLRNQPYAYETYDREVQGEVVYDQVWAERMSNIIGHAIMAGDVLEAGETVYKVAAGSLARKLVEKHEKELLAGLRIQDMGFLVVAKSKAAAQRSFEGTPEVLVEIETVAGTRVLSQKQFLIFERGTTVEVLSSEMVKDVLHIKGKLV